MSDTIDCPNCSATLPAGASFCTSCGQRTAPAASAAVDEPAPAASSTDDHTRVDTPGLNDATQVFTPPAPAPTPEPAAPAAPAPSAPWAPDPATAPPTPAPPAWEQPAAPAAPAWQQPAPAAAPEQPAWQQPAAPAAAGWGAPAQAPGQPGPPAWGAPAPAPAATSSSAAGGSVLGGLLAIVGGVLALAGVFTPWIGGNRTDATLTGFDLTSGDKGFDVGRSALLTFESMDPYIIAALGVVAVVAGLLLFTGKARPIMRIAAIVAGVAIVGLVAYDWTQLAQVVKDGAGSDFEISAKIGFFLTIVGGVVTAVAALMPAKKSAGTSV